eukprot:TRINITY_DN14482_c0_g1_i1.p1 TRINITY_DN14482_c0_g1~~TRINITY_DN14482_c0_g1_i1.p1  ORF type:complete len:389 (+),score=91.79 TRINITY_DN14482_c0_g1_i1:59-1225(+)
MHRTVAHFILRRAQPGVFVFRRTFAASVVSSSDTPLVRLDYADLLAGRDVSDAVYAAYGPKGLGALTIKNVPEYAELRRALLPMSHKVAHLPADAKTALEDPESMWNAGWSHGKEKLGDEPDFAKGSFYNNPLYDEAGTAEERAKYPFFYPKNRWPKELPAVEPAFKALGRVMHEAVVLLAAQVDRLTASRIPSYVSTLMQHQMRNTQKVKGRLLYYFPTDKTNVEDAWIGWHNDSGFFTALTRDMFFNDVTGAPMDNPDPNGGLWIVNRSGGSVRVHIPEDDIAVQCGEGLQIVTGGLLLATPHAVRASQAPPGVKLARATFPVFIDTAAEFPLSPPKGIQRAQVFDSVMVSKVPPLEKRWLRDGVKFVDFLGDTFTQYYAWAKGQK